MIQRDRNPGVGKGAAVVNRKNGVGPLLAAGDRKHDAGRQREGLRQAVADLEATPVERDHAGRKRRRLFPSQHAVRVQTQAPVKGEGGVVPNQLRLWVVQHQQFRHGKGGRGSQIQRVLVEPHLPEGQFAVALQAEVVEQIKIHVFERRRSCGFAEIVAERQRGVLQIQRAARNRHSFREGQDSPSGRKREAWIEGGRQPPHGEVGFLCGQSVLGHRRTVVTRISGSTPVVPLAVRWSLQRQVGGGGTQREGELREIHCSHYEAFIAGDGGILQQFELREVVGLHLLQGQHPAKFKRSAGEVKAGRARIERGFEVHLQRAGNRKVASQLERGPLGIDGSGNRAALLEFESAPGRIQQAADVRRACQREAASVGVQGAVVQREDVLNGQVGGGRGEFQIGTVEVQGRQRHWS